MASEPTADMVDAQPLAKVETQPLATQGVVMTEAGALLSQGIAKGLDPAALKQLIELVNTQEDRAAAKEFAAAFAELKGSLSPIARRSTANVVTKGGSRYSYTYAEIAEIAITVDPHVHKCGFSYRWSPGKDDKGQPTCTCILLHAGGHSETCTVPVVLETLSAMAPQQKIGNALTYAERYSLIGVLGLTTTAVDDDAADPAGSADPITEEQALTLNDLLIEVGADKPRFMVYMTKLAGVEVKAFADIPANCFDAAVAALNKKRKVAP